MRLHWAFSTLTVALLAGCGDTLSDEERLTFVADGDALIANGVIDARALPAFREAIEAHPDTRRLILQNIPGSADDEANLVLSRMVRDLGLTTIVPGDGMVASGGTDLFFAGAARQVENGACIGVHSWAFEDGTEGRAFPRDDPEHQAYLDFYSDLGIPAAFYWYTLEIATAEGMHWMSPVEIGRFDMDTLGGLPSVTGAGITCDDR